MDGDRMPQVTFASALQRHVPQPPVTVAARTVKEALEAVFRDNPRLRGYVIDEQGVLRHHVAVFVDGKSVADPKGLADAVTDRARIDVIQALSGG